MAINYPTSLDSFTNPSATDLLTSPSHAQQHSDINDAMEAVQTKLAIGNTVVGTYTAYTPSFFNLTVGDGLVSGAYARVNDFVHVYGSLTFGSTTSVTGAVSIVLPVNHSLSITAFAYGFVQLRDNSTGVFYPGGTRYNGLTGSVFAASYGITGSNTFLNVITATVPFTWTVSDQMTWNLYYKAA
jgi:hypothetical protein